MTTPLPFAAALIAASMPLAACAAGPWDAARAPDSPASAIELAASDLEAALQLYRAERPDDPLGERTLLATIDAGRGWTLAETGDRLLLSADLDAAMCAAVAADPRPAVCEAGLITAPVAPPPEVNDARPESWRRLDRREDAAPAEPGRAPVETSSLPPPTPLAPATAPRAPEVPEVAEATPAFYRLPPAYRR